MVSSPEWTVMASQGDEADRQALTDLVDEYLDALVANDPDAVPIDPDADFVENIEAKTPGEGLWERATGGPTDFAIYVPDPVADQVAFLGVIEEANEPSLLGLRLAVDDGRITEMEHVLARQITPAQGDHANFEHLQELRPEFTERVPPAERASREELFEIGVSYYEAIVHDDGSVAPFAEGCVRRENGFQTTCVDAPPDADPGEVLRALDAGEQLTSGAMSYITDIEPVRVEIADVEYGLACGLSQFRHPMEERTLEIEGVPGVDTVERAYDPFDTPALHVFKIRNGEIQAIEAVGFGAPYDAPTGWE